MPYTTRADGDVLTASSHNANCRDQVISTVTSATRPAGTEGQLIYETDTDLYQAYTGAAWVPFSGLGAWITYTPTVTQSGLVTTSIIRARYIKIGRMVTFDVIIELTGAGTANNAFVVSLPVNAASVNTNTTVGIGHMRDASAGFKYFGTAVLTSAAPGAVGLLEIAQGTDRLLGATGAAFSAALASTDFISIQGTYESAA